MKGRTRDKLKEFAGALNSSTIAHALDWQRFYAVIIETHLHDQNVLPDEVRDFLAQSNVLNESKWSDVYYEGRQLLIQYDKAQMHKA